MTAGPANPGELTRMFARYCDETISPDEAAQLEAWLADDPACMKQFLLYIEIHSVLAWQGRQPDDELIDLVVDPAATATGLSPVNEGRSEASPKRRGVAVIADSLDPQSHPIRFLTAASVIVLLSWWGLWSARDGRTLTGPGKLTADVNDLMVVAELQSSYDCEFPVESRTVAAGAQLRAGELIEITRGSAKFVFRSGVAVVVEGPAAMEMLSANAMRLDRGTATVRAQGPSKDFLLVSPDAAIVDLGTSFGVHCDENQATEISVFEGAVEVRSDPSASEGRVLGLGSSARIRRGEHGSDIDFIASDGDRYERLLQHLWDDAPAIDGGEGTAVIAGFNDAPIPGTVDTFYGATCGRGWRSPWMAAGNPVGEIRYDNALAEEGDPYLRMRFLKAIGRVIAREYGPRSSFDPDEPHVITWRWRFDGNPEHFGRHFRDRVLFYGRNNFRSNTSAEETWLIRLAAADEVDGRFRAGYPMHWCVFDSHGGAGGASFSRETLVDSGMTLKPGVVYRFAVVVYPREARYDVAIRDDEEVFMRTGLSFRNRTPGQANVAHFGIRSDDETADLAFSLDSVRVEPLDDRDLEQQVN